MTVDQGTGPPVHGASRGDARERDGHRARMAVVGLGPMGSAIAKALHPLDPGLRVWNRSTDPMRAHAALGMTAAASPGETFATSEVVFVCVRDYAVTRALLQSCDPAALRGRTVVQLSTGTPAEARELATWMRERDVAYLDGALLSYPSEIGTPDSVAVYAGAREAFDRLGDALTAIGPDLVFCGPAAGAAAAQAQGALLLLYGATFGFLQGAAIAESEHVSVEACAELGVRVASMMPGLLRGTAGIIRGRAGVGVEALPQTDVTALAQISATSDAAGVSSVFSDAMLAVMQQAVLLDVEGESMAVAYDVLRPATASPRRTPPRG